MEEWLSATLTIPPNASEAVSFQLFELGARAIWEDYPAGDGRLVFKASFPKEDAMRLMVTLPQVLSGVSNNLELPLSSFGVAIELLPIEDYSEAFKEQQIPILVSSSLVISPTFWTGDLASHFGLEGNNLPPVLKMDPGAAFGSGRHPTTFLSLKILSSLKESGHAPERILDIGAGSGILALSSALLFPEAEITGIDNDPDTIPVAINNRNLNNLAKVDFSDKDLSALSPGFSIILANLTLNPLVKLAPEITRLSAPNTILVLSGIIDSQARETAEAYRKEGWKWNSHLGQGEWSALSLELNPDKEPEPETPEPPESPERIVTPEPSLETPLKHED
jgi:ribosomal protein L11 methyltransferase